MLELGIVREGKMLLRLGISILLQRYQSNPL